VIVVLACTPAKKDPSSAFGTFSPLRRGEGLSIGFGVASFLIGEAKQNKWLVTAFTNSTPA
jgi:hypothetical protein